MLKENNVLSEEEVDFGEGAKPILSNSEEEVQEIIKTSLDIEITRIDEGFKLAGEIFEFQKSEMKCYRIFVMVILSMQYIGLIALTIYSLIINNGIDTIIFTTIVGVIIETITLFGLMIKYIYSNQLKDIIKGLYTHKHYSEEIKNSQDKNKFEN